MIVGVFTVYRVGLSHTASSLVISTTISKLNSSFIDFFSLNFKFIRPEIRVYKSFNILPLNHGKNDKQFESLDIFTLCIVILEIFCIEH